MAENPTQPRRASVFDDVMDAPAREMEMPAFAQERINREDEQKAPAAIMADIESEDERLHTETDTVPDTAVIEREADTVPDIVAIKREDEPTPAPVKIAKPPKPAPLFGAELSEKRAVVAPDRIKKATQAQRKPQAAARSKARSARVPERRAQPLRARRAYAGEIRLTFWEKHLRSLIAMFMLAASIALFLAWGYATKPGMRAFAQLGVGGVRGYILLGDDCMEDANYQRAVVYYYKALDKSAVYEAAIKLARACAQTGDLETEVKALLLCANRYPDESEAFTRLKQIYPIPGARPKQVAEALEGR